MVSQGRGGRRRRAHHVGKLELKVRPVFDLSHDAPRQVHDQTALTHGSLQGPTANHVVLVRGQCASAGGSFRDAIGTHMVREARVVCDGMALYVSCL